MTSSDANPHAAHARAIGALACPCCGGGFSADAGTLVCDEHHRFDLARQGYVNLLPGGAHPGTADSAAMVAARARFLESGAFLPLADAIVTAVRDHLDRAAEGVVVDVGAGTGWLLSQVIEALPNRSGIALDVSKYAARRAASAHARVFSVVCDAWATLPVRTGAASAVLSFFAPRNPAEFARIIAPDGVLFVVTPHADHLEQIVAPLGLITVDPRKSERLEASFADLFNVQDVRPMATAMRLTRDQLSDIAAMGPSAHHTVADDVTKAVAAFGDVTEVTAAVDVRVMRPHS